MYFDEGDSFEDSELLLFYVGIAISIVGALIITLHDPAKEKNRAASNNNLSSGSSGNEEITGTDNSAQGQVTEEKTTKPSSSKKIL